METNTPQKPDMLALMPCGLRNAFKEHVDAFVAANSDRFANFKYLVEGNVNHENRYYPTIDSLESVDDLPDILMTSDVNAFLHHRFMQRFSGHFTTYLPQPPHPFLADVGFCDPNAHYSMYTGNLLVMVVDKRRLGNRPMPTGWGDLLRPDFANDIILRGEDGFFCNAVLLPLYKAFGMEGIRRVANNVKSGRHPAEMVKLAGSGREEAATIYVMPYFFAVKIRQPQVELVWPSDGAILSPVFMLIKNEVVSKHQALLDFLFSKETAELLVSHLAPTLHPEVSHEAFPGSVSWLGWDFLQQNDIGELKARIQRCIHRPVVPKPKGNHL